MNEQPEYYDIVPEFNNDGRLCNYHTGKGTTARVMAYEWDRFNQLAGRQHEIKDGFVVYNPTLIPCFPDETIDAPSKFENYVDMLYDSISILLGGKDDELDDIIDARS